MFWKEWRKTLKGWRKPNLQGLQVGYETVKESPPKNFAVFRLPFFRKMKGNFPLGRAVLSGRKLYSSPFLGKSGVIGLVPRPLGAIIPELIDAKDV
jgi:hypothetical protein